MMRAVWCALLLSAPLIAQAPSTETRGDGFVLRSALPPATVTAVACDLDTAVRALRHPKAKTTFPRVVAVNSARGIREWLPQFGERGTGNPLGAYWHGLYGHHIVVRVDARPDERLRRVLHEYAHFVTHLIHPEPPRWLDEGLSEVWEHATIRAGTIEIGGPVNEHLKRLRSGKGWMPIQDLLAAHTIPVMNDSATAMFYAQSWALVHHLLFSTSGGQVVLERIPDAAEVPSDDVLRAYVQGPLAQGVTISTGATTGRECGGDTNSRQVPLVDALLGQAQALADGERPDAAIPLVEQILVSDPHNVDATEVLGFVHFKENRPAEAARVFDQVIAAGSGTFIAYYYRALLAGPIPERSHGAGSVPQVDYLRRAIALKPDFTPAIERLREITGGKELPLALYTRVWDSRH